MNQKNYIAIDLKSFYASVECVERNLDPLTTNLIVADESKTDKTICLAVSPSLKSYGVPGRPRLFEVIQKVDVINEKRKWKTKENELIYYSYDDNELRKENAIGVAFIVAPPRMALYIEYSARIYEVYLKYIAPEDIHVYSIDEVFIDVSRYLHMYEKSAHEIAMMIIKDVLATTGITATCGIGTNLYLAKVAMDIMAKKMPADKDGVRIAELDEFTYRKELWNHTPITDFWRVGNGYARRLQSVGIETMGEIALYSIQNEDLFYSMFGKNAELLIDHAWGYESCSMEHIKSYKSSSHSLGSGQVLIRPYKFEEARIVVYEMLDLLALDLVDKHLVTDQIVLSIGYDRENLLDPEIAYYYDGAVTMDGYGKKVPKHAHGSTNIGRYTSSSKFLANNTLKLFDEIVDSKLHIRRISICANHVINENEIKNKRQIEQLNLFIDYEKERIQKEKEKIESQKENSLQKTLLMIKDKYGKNAILKGINLMDSSTTRERNQQIGGHRA